MCLCFKVVGDWYLHWKWLSYCSLGFLFLVCVCVCAVLLLLCPLYNPAGVVFFSFLCVRARARGLARLVYLQERKSILTNVKECMEGKLIWRVSLF